MIWLLLFPLKVSEPTRKAYRFRHMACILDATELFAAYLTWGCPEFSDGFKLVALRMGAGALQLPLI